jgi:hypothetical protein
LQIQEATEGVPVLPQAACKFKRQFRAITPYVIGGTGSGLTADDAI